MSTSNSASQDEAQKRMQAKLAADFEEHVKKFSVRVQFPAVVESDKGKTSPDLVQHRLLEAGVLFEDDQENVESVTEAVTKFINNLNQTGCFNAVQVSFEDDAKAEKQLLRVQLKEKNWYKLYIGGGLKHDSLFGSDGSHIPKVQFETTAGLLNLSGNLDKTSAGYTVDHTSATTLHLSHERPLFSMLPSDWSDALLTSMTGSQVHFASRAVLDTVDHEFTKSCKEYQRLLQCRVCNHPTSFSYPSQSTEPFVGLDWQLVLRDLLPRRHGTLPYALDASPEIATMAGPSLKHSIVWQMLSNGALCDDKYSPTDGLDYHLRWEVAGPPGDVGFFKVQGGTSVHIPFLGKHFALHTSLNSGFLQPISFAGLCPQAPTLSDRFFVGGPMQLRGFLPSGIGPRSSGRGGSSSPGGDALGGDFYYTATTALSMPLPSVSNLVGGSSRDDTDTPVNEGSTSNVGSVRLFGFANAGTLVSSHSGLSLSAIAQTTRFSVGGGISAGTPMGRVEVTYAIPMRYGPRDARRSVQFGIGFRVE